MPKDFYPDLGQAFPANPKMKFKDWYMKRYSVPAFPGGYGERIDATMERLAEGMAEWCDLVAAGAVPEAPPSTNGGE